ncbi:divergent polysaccharide deacetylase family protein [Roseospira goensis]|uniref:Polysaccharide deacetylase 2 family uncharacterized protein YibQ n=1 Tax=Roseospira goensis TaxID=391922 RepID=A0A7W6S0F3_9PROT|nr:divergent polysaccharide deacetylase family protein [Roseospira goensis]MBB4286563.1 polysaccharide deacetylase 2 family uncharacterized protein YibQ [Roseospira goensis]
MKLPGFSRGRGRRRSTDPLGDPFEGLDLDSLDATDSPAADSPAAHTGPPPRDARRTGAASASPPPPAADDDFELDLDLGESETDHDPDSARGVARRLLRTPDPEDLDDGRGGRRRGLWAAAAVLVLVAGVGAGFWILDSGPTGDDLDPAPDERAAATTAPGDVPRLETPDRVVMALPPLDRSSAPARAEDGAEDGNDTAVIADPTAATDRSTSRRPWLEGGPDAGPAASADGMAPEPTTEPTAEPAVETAPPPAPERTGPTEESPVADASGVPPADEPETGGTPAPEPVAQTEPAEATADPDPAPASNPWAAMSARGRAAAEAGVRARVDLAAPDIALPEVPGLLPVPAGVEGVVEPEAPNRLSGAPSVPSYNQLPQAAGTRANPLPEAPRRGLLADSPYGPVPRIDNDGTAPWQAYAARDPAPPDRPRVAIVVHGLGMMQDSLEAAITRLPPAVTLSFTPYARNLADKMAAARQAGHEVMLDLPMESDGFPAEDPGPLGLLTMLPTLETVDRLQQILAKGGGYVGVLAADGGRFAGAPEQMEVVLDTLRQSGLLYLHQGNPRALIANRRSLPALRNVDVIVDRRGFAESIDARLSYLTRVAQARGTAVGLMTASPLGFARLRAWAADLEAAGVALAPLSAVVARGGAAPGTGGASRSEAGEETGHSGGSPNHG